MNKRRFFILLPLLLVLSLFGSTRVDSRLPFRSSVAALTFSGQQYHEVDAVHLPVLDKQKHDKNKNKIRIKAWDDYAAIDIAVPWSPAAAVHYEARAVYNSYTSFFHSIRSSAHGLRGPPAIVC